MAPTPEFLRMPFKEALIFLKNKVVLPTESTKAMTEEHQRWAFMISGITRGEILEDTKFLLAEAIEKGNDFSIFRQQFRKLIERKGWKPSEKRIENIFSTNIKRAYGEGRYQQMSDPNIMKSRPYRQFVHGNSPDPRPAHIAIDGKVYDATENFCDVVKGGYCDWNCKCKMLSLSERDLKRLGLTVSKPPDPNTIAGPGFRGKKGSGSEQERKEVLADALTRLSPELRAKVKADLKSKKII